MENKTFIVNLLNTHADLMVRFVNQQSQESFTKSDNGKWSIGQNLDHLIRSLSPVNQALLLPSFVLRIMFGKPNRTGRSYQGLVDRYHQKLSAGGTATGRFIPPAVSWEQKASKVADFNLQKDRMIKRLESWSEDQLDQYLLPHPLLGKITVREMLFFSAYHIQHHLHLLEEREISHH
jgi:DinB superfamily